MGRASGTMMFPWYRHVPEGTDRRAARSRTNQDHPMPLPSSPRHRVSTSSRASRVHLVEPLEARRLFAVPAPAGVQQADIQGASAVFFTEATAAEWGLPAPDASTPIYVFAEVFVWGGVSDETNGPNLSFPMNALFSLQASTTAGERVIEMGAFATEGVSFHMSPGARSATLDVVLPGSAYLGSWSTPVNISVHMEWTAAGGFMDGGATVVRGADGDLVQISRTLGRNATASGTVTVDAYGATNFAPGEPSFASVFKNYFQTINPTAPARASAWAASPPLASDLFGETPVLN
jgi:hypothetical protein